MASTKVAVCQMQATSDVEANYEVVKSLVKEAAEKAAKVGDLSEYESFINSPSVIMFSVCLPPRVL